MRRIGILIAAAFALGISAHGQAFVPQQAATGYCYNAIAGIIEINSSATASTFVPQRAIVVYGTNNGSPAILACDQNGNLSVGSILGVTVPALTDGALTYSSSTGLFEWVPDGSNGTVSSVTFTGDGTVLSATQSSAVTTFGTVVATLANAAPNSVLAGPATGGAAAPTYQTAPTISAANFTNFPSSLVTLTGTQSLTNKTLDGVTPTVMAYLDATSSIQAQLNTKAALTAATLSNLTTVAGGTFGSGAFATAYVLPTATPSVLGGVKPDGTTIINSVGAISVANPYNPTGAITPSSVAVNGDFAFTAAPRAFLIGNTGVQASIVANGQYSPTKIVKSATIENVEGTAAVLSTCSANPVLTLEDCGISAGACSSPTPLASVTLAAANTVTDGTITNATLAAGHYVVWETTAGTCVSSSVSGSAEYRMN
jgi:hypothetical protein